MAKAFYADGRTSHQSPRSFYCDSLIGVPCKIYMESLPIPGTSRTISFAESQSPSRRAPFPAPRTSGRFPLLLLAPARGGSPLTSAGTGIRAVFSSVQHAAYGIQNAYHTLCFLFSSGQSQMQYFFFYFGRNVLRCPRQLDPSYLH